jgi:dihydrofolate reductase
MTTQPAEALHHAVELTTATNVSVSGNLVRWLLDNHLVDEIVLLTYPVVVGQGTRLFPAAGPDTALELVDSRATPSGVTIQVYRPTGRPQYAT